MRAYGLGHDATDFLAALAMYKVLRFLEEGLRLRAACDLQCDGDLQVTRPQGLSLPALSEVTQALPGMIQTVAAQGLFAEPAVTTVEYVSAKKKAPTQVPEEGDEVSEEG